MNLILKKLSIISKLNNLKNNMINCEKVISKVNINCNLNNINFLKISVECNDFDVNADKQRQRLPYLSDGLNNPKNKNFQSKKGPFRLKIPHLNTRSSKTEILPYNAPLKFGI